MRKIYYWACGTWCDQDDIEEYLTFMSDAYGVVNVSYSMSEEEIWQTIISLN